MNRIKAFLLLVIFLTFSLVLLPKVTGQGTQIKPSGAQFDPCLLPNPPSYCPPPPEPDATPRDFRKGIALGPASVLRTNEFGWDQDLLGPGGKKTNLSILNDTGTGYLRLWVSWPALQPERSLELLNETSLRYIEKDTREENSPAALLNSLDHQIKVAQRNGLRVILTIDHNYPTWINNEPLPKEVKDELKKVRAQLSQSRRVPDRLGVWSEWGNWVTFLVRRYGFAPPKIESNRFDANGLSVECKADLTQEACSDYLRYVDFLEVVNEPNHTLWPQGTDKNPFMARKVARMFKTAQQIVRDNSAAGVTALKLAGPATSDTLKDDARNTNYQRFTLQLFKELRDIAFEADENLSWSHHNYLDVEEQRNCPPGVKRCARPVICVGSDCREAAPCITYRKAVGKKRLSRENSAAWVESTLAKGAGGYRWTGMTEKNLKPAILLTEGGARLNKVWEIYGCRLDIPKAPLPHLCRCLTNIGLPFPCRKAPEDPLGGECIVEVDFGNPDYLAFSQAVQGKMGIIETWQAKLVENSFKLMTQPGPMSNGVALFTNYLAYTDPIYDTGMFNYAGTCEDYRKRAMPNRAFGDICPGEGGEPQDGRPLFRMWQAIPIPTP
jgi:hypothetical protein